LFKDFLRPVFLSRTDLYNRNVETNDEINLVQAASNGDADSFSRLCAHYYPALVAIAYSHLSDKDIAEDAAQETLYIAYRDISKLKKADLFVSWLTRICRNISSDMANKSINKS
jgi:DNA-directed RNA polymerase specialized sigma24 family protein